MLTQQFEQALHYALSAHDGQKRKGTQIPYISHLLAVAGLVLEHGGNEDEAIGGLLHDAGEDAGGVECVHDIRLRFGAAVGDIVEGCSDTLQTPKPPWRERKEAYIAKMATESPSVRLVSAADKLHNARSIVSDYHRLGERLWQRFNGGKDGTLWYYRTLASAFQTAGSSPLVDDLGRVVDELEKLGLR